MKPRDLATLLAAAALLAAAPKETEKPAAPSKAAAPTLARATFAGGCFWCMEPPFEALDGVASVTSGYAGGTRKNPTYREVSSGSTGHAEVVQVAYDPSRISYERLLDVFWLNVDPTTADRQFCDWGKQYRPAIFFHDDGQRELAEESRRAVEKRKTFRQPLVVEISPLSHFYPAEEYHQDYYKKNPVKYKSYRTQCGRDQRLQQLWGDAAKHGASSVR